MEKIINRLQYITYQEIDKTASQQALEFCAGGGDWIQLRIKNKPVDYILAEAKRCNAICQQSGATFIINDDAKMVAQIDADGVHLGKNDMSVLEARKIVGDYKIIGGTANTFDDILRLTDQGVDYIGLGPFKFTDTKKDLSPILGIDKYTEILKECVMKNISTPIIAIGGIVIDDFKNLFNTGIHGIALSSYLAKHDNIGAETIIALTEIGKAHSFNFTKKQ